MGTRQARLRLTRLISWPRMFENSISKWSGSGLEPHRTISSIHKRLSDEKNQYGSIETSLDPSFRDKMKTFSRASRGAATAATQDHGLPGQVPSPHAPRSEISRSGVHLTPIMLSSCQAKLSINMEILPEWGLGGLPERPRHAV